MSEQAGSGIPKRQYRRRLAVGVIQGLVSTASIGAVLLISAGTVGWMAAWMLLSLLLAYYMGMFVWGISKQPEVLYERVGTIVNLELRWDKLILGVYFISSYTLYILAGLDYRRFQGAQMALILGLAGQVMVVFVFAITIWAIASNPFASGAVRVQAERGHAVVERGPYRFIRHPIYLASLFYGLGLPLLLDSWRALLPGALIAAAFVLRARLEDAVLNAELPGYREYCRRVPHRLIPGVW